MVARLFLGVLKITYSQDARTDFDGKYVPCMDVPFWNRKTKIQTTVPFTP